MTIRRTENAGPARARGACVFILAWGLAFACMLGCSGIKLPGAGGGDDQAQAAETDQAAATAPASAATDENEANGKAASQAPAAGRTPAEVAPGAAPPEAADEATADVKARGKAKPSALMLVLDASGSMRGKVGGKRKMNVARDVVGGLVKGLPEGTDTGLIAYGHRDKDNCDDIELLMALSPIDKPAFRKRLAKIKPKGQTPLTAAARQAIDLAKDGQRRSTVVLVSDGLETCDADPCAMVKDAKAEGVDFVLYVVGFGLKGEDVSALKCAAEAGGGKYLEADSADELTRALDLATQEVKVATGTLVVDPRKGDTPIESGVSLFAAGDGERLSFETVHFGADHPGKFQLPEGKYDVLVEPGARDQGLGKAKLAGISITAGKVTRLPVPLGAGKMVLKLTHNGGPVPEHEPWIQVFEQGSDDDLSSSFSLDRSRASSGIYSMELAPGAYRVRMIDHDVVHMTDEAREFTIKAGQTTNVPIDIKSAQLTIRASNGKRLWVGMHRNGELYKGENASSPAVYTLGKAHYTVETKIDDDYDSRQEFELTVKGGEEIEKVLQASEGEP